MGELYDCFKDAGAKFYGATATSEIEFDESKAVVDGKWDKNIGCRGLKFGSVSIP